MTVALGFGLEVTIGPVVEPPLAVIVWVLVICSGFVVGVVVSKIIKTLSLGLSTLSILKVTVFAVFCTSTSIGEPFK